MSEKTPDVMAALDTAQAAFQKASAATGQGNNPTVVWTPELVSYLAVAVLSFTFACLVLGSLLLWRSRAGGTQVLRLFGVLTIIGMSAVLLVVGYSNEQLTPIVGLFGAIAGYLLGKESTTVPPKAGETP